MREITIKQVDETRSQILATITSTTLTHEQKVHTLAVLADSLLEVMELPDGLTELMGKKIICDLNEGHAPVRPRYIVPDYRLFLKQGSAFLRLPAPKNLHDALNALVILYRHVPSVTDFPVYIGNLDTLLEPFVIQMDYNEAKAALRRFLIYLDRTITDSFCHANIGPDATVTGQIILELERELENVVPNLTIKYDPDLTPDEFGRMAVLTQMKTAKPSFANHRMFAAEFGGDYSIASCYNGLLIGGGAFTLVRVLLGNLAKEASGSEDFFQNQLPRCLDVMTQYMDERIRFIIEESNFFESNFLAKEGLIHKERFTGMLGLVGMAECVNLLMEKDGKSLRYGRDEAADALGVQIMEAITAFNTNHSNQYCPETGQHFFLHGQVGISTDEGQTPNCRIPIGEEPAEMSDHLIHCGKFHKYFQSGIGEIFLIDETVHTNPDFALDIIKGAFAGGVRYLSMHSSDSDMIRVTGYLAKKSEIEKLEKGTAVLHDTTALGMGQQQNSHIYDRKIR